MVSVEIVVLLTLGTRKKIVLFSKLTWNVNNYSLRSTDKYLLNTKRTNTKIGSRAFSAAAPETWNALPTDIKLTDSLNKFKIDLKTHLFRIAFK